ncbi:MAG: hypothetical protein WB820_12770, partial [Rhodoplanes sp.]
QESGLRENCTSRLSERAEAGRKLHLSRLYSEEGVDNKTRRSEGPLLEPSFYGRRDRVTAHKAQRTPKEKVRVLQRKLYRAAKAQPKRTFGVLYDKVCSLESMV